MHAVHISAIFAFVVVVVCCENCENLSTVKIILYNDVNGGVAKNITTVGVITLSEDVFQVLVANQTIKKLCQNYITINNELTVLQLLNNSIEDISPFAFNIAATLALLKISKNPLNTIKKGVFNEVKTKELDLSNNNIATIEEDALDNEYLEIVKLNYNSIKEFDPSWFAKTPNVYKFSAIYNEITKIPERAFANMTKSRPLRIRLSANRISEIHPNALSGAGPIEVLRLNGNLIREIPEKIFVNQSIKSLQLDTNKLKCFPDDLFNSTVNNLEFSDNKHFECVCLKKIRHFVKEKKISVIYPAIICEDKAGEVNIVFNGNRSYEIPLLPPPPESDSIIKLPENNSSKIK